MFGLDLMGNLPAVRASSAASDLPVRDEDAWDLGSLGSRDCPDYTLRVHIPKNHVLTQNLYYNPSYPNPKYPIIGYMDPKSLNPI